jgi:hypothetical protein
MTASVLDSVPFRDRLGDAGNSEERVRPRGVGKRRDDREAILSSIASAVGEETERALMTLAEDARTDLLLDL